VRGTYDAETGSETIENGVANAALKLRERIRVASPFSTAW